MSVVIFAIPGQQDTSLYISAVHRTCAHMHSRISFGFDIPSKPYKVPQLSCERTFCLYNAIPRPSVKPFQTLLRSFLEAMYPCVPHLYPSLVSRHVRLIRQCPRSATSDGATRHHASTLPQICALGYQAESPPTILPMCKNVG